MIGGNAAGRWRVAIIRLICNMSFSFPLESWWQKEIHIGQKCEHQFLIVIGRTSNKLKHNFSTPNELEHVHLLVIELEHPFLGFERSNIELRT